MRKGVHLFLGVALGLSANLSPRGETLTHARVTPAAPSSLTPQARNSISGNVFDPSGRSLSDIQLELLDSYYSNIARTKTNGSGRYVFNGMPAGTYKVRVLPYGTDFREQTQEVVITNFSSGTGSTSTVTGGDSAQLDFYLRPRTTASAGPFAVAAPGAIFVQEVPDDAKKFYDQGLVKLGNKQAKEGFEDLKRALEIFPNYFLALDRLGTEYVVRGYYEAAFILLTKATEINKRSFSSTLGLGLALYHLKHNDKAIETLRRAATFYDKSPNAHLWLGIALRRAGKLDQAEASLKLAQLKTKEKFPEIYWQLALVYSKQKKYKEAADSLELFLKSQPDSRDSEKIRQLIAQLRQKAIAP